MREDFIFLRVSKKDLLTGSDDEKIQQDYNTQLPQILSKFNLDIDKCTVVKEKGTAYDTEKYKKRYGWNEIIKKIIGNISLWDFYIGNCKKKEISIYVFDFNRFFRNIEYGLLFAIICVFFNVKIYAVNQEDLNPRENEEIGERIGRYIRIAMYSFLAEGYSDNISKNTKKSVVRENGKTTKSTKGKKWGRWFMFSDGIKKPLEPREADKLYSYIVNQIKNYEKNNVKYYYPLICEKVLKNFSIKISSSYISNIKKETLRK